MAVLVFSESAEGPVGNEIHETSCPMCGEEHLIIMRSEDYVAWRVNRNFIQTVFPNVSADHREVAVSGTCPKCWEEMCAGFDDDDDICTCEIPFTGQCESCQE